MRQSVRLGAAVETDTGGSCGELKTSAPAASRASRYGSVASPSSSFATLVMFTMLLAGASFPLVFSGLIVEKIPFSVFNVALYLYSISNSV